MKLLLISGSIVCLFIAIFFGFIYFGGSIPATNSLEMPTDPYAQAQVLSAACRSKLATEASLEAPVRAEMQPISQQLNEDGFDMSAYVRPGGSVSLDDLANKVSPGELQQVQTLENQYSTLNNRLITLQQQYSCQ